MDCAGAGARGSGPARFLAFCGEPSALRQWLSSLIPVADAPERLNRIFDCSDLIVYASPETPFARLGEDRGIVFGEPVDWRPRSDAADLSSAAEAIHAAICGDPGREPPLGGYAAFLRARGAVTVLRGPGRAIAVHHAEAGPVAAFFSHRALGRQLAPRSSGGSNRPKILALEPGGRRKVNTSTG